MTAPAFRLTVPMQVRFRDTDAMGHVNNAVYVTYLEVARQEYWSRVMGVGSYTDCGLILARTEIDFRSPAFVADDLVVGIRASRLGRSSFDFTYEIRAAKEGRLVVDAVSVQVMYDYATRSPRPLTEDERRRMTEFEGSIGPAAVRPRG
jgi:acyl-CoA thioester hydrolase